MKTKPKIALAMIVKGTDEEAKLLERCLENVHKYVDGMFITFTYKKDDKPYDSYLFNSNVRISHFEWINDFAAARNFNFSQVPKEYDYILWCDADDMYRGLENLEDILEQYPNADAFAFNYLYDFDEYKQPTVVHKKTMLIRNDGCATWKGALHEDLIENRSIDVRFIPTIERMHFTTDSRVEVAKTRNVEVAQKDFQENPDDPRTYWNLGNSYVGAGEFSKAKEVFEKFIPTSGSEEEVYLTRLRLADIEHTLGNREKTIENIQIAIGMTPHYSDAYLRAGYYYFEYMNYDKAEYYLKLGLVMTPQYNSLIVYNPRDYDYNPMMLLSKVYFNKSRPDMALPLLEACLSIYPENEYVKGLVYEMKSEADKLDKALSTVKKLQGVTDKEEIRYVISSLPQELRSHPAISSIWNMTFIKTESTGKDLVYYCGMTDHEWNPDLFKTKGFGGSEEAVVNLSKEWAKMGWNVTVYNNCGPEAMTRDGVTYRPFWEYNYRDKQDVTILWRHPKLLDYDLNCKNVFVDLHDVISQGEFNEKRLKKINKIFVKTNAHRILFPQIPDDKFAVVPNGLDFDLFNQPEVKKDQYLLVNTSSPDRSLDVLPKLFKKIKERVPEARLKWAYGFHNFDAAYAKDKQKQEWKKKILSEMEEAGIENLGRLSQKECAKLYMEGNILAYPSEFYEIDCITVKKAQAAGCMPATTDFAAFKESVQYGIKVPSKKNIENWSKDYQFSFGIDDEETQNAWVDAVVKQLQTPLTDRKEMKKWTHKFDWKLISKQWNDLLK